MLGPETYFWIVYSFKAQILERGGKLDGATERLLGELEQALKNPGTTAASTAFMVHGSVPR